MGTLYVVATPIGNLEDITLRAIRVLQEVGLIAAEDTRKTVKLLSRYSIRTPMESYHRHSSPARTEQIVRLLETRDVALVSEAGMPGVSDPGQDLISAAIAAGFPVVPIPGPSALLSGLVVSGLPTDRFLFLGFLPRVRSDRRRLLSSVASLPFTLVLFEAPHRLKASLDDLQETLGNRPAAAARELTKVHEEVARGTISDLRNVFEERAPRGEFTLVIAPPTVPGPVAEEHRPTAGQVARRLRVTGERGKEAVGRIMVEAKCGRREAYQAWLESAGAEEAQADRTCS